VVGFGLSGVKEWAWHIAVIGVALGVLQGTLGLFGGGTFGFICGNPWLAIPIGVLIYLLTPGVRRAHQVG
jgi:hypothetical protein